MNAMYKIPSKELHSILSNVIMSIISAPDGVTQIEYKGIGKAVSKEGELLFKSGKMDIFTVTASERDAVVNFPVLATGAKDKREGIEIFSLTLHIINFASVALIKIDNDNVFLTKG